MLKHMVPQENGQCILKTKLFLLFLLASLKAPSPDLFKGLQRDTLAPPRTPPVRKPQDDRRAKREELAQPPRRHLRYDDDDEDPNSNKENIPPYDPNADDWRKTLLQHLLQKWEAELNWYQEEVLRDLQGLRQKLGIPQ
ncbi:E4 [Gammapapillomavirus 22]|uniref:E4 n=1 Tax=Gammapapillomavirus 22 TaxID=1961679 RepID=A0A2D2AM50_9PAPI|nr:E4 [Gammapapillomavirus 22]